MPNYILSHTSSFKSAWTWFILMLTLYTAWMVPYSVAFQYRGGDKEQGPGVLFWLIIDSFVDVIFIADIGMDIEHLLEHINQKYILYIILSFKKL